MILIPGICWLFNYHIPGLVQLEIIIYLALKKRNVGDGGKKANAKSSSSIEKTQKREENKKRTAMKNKKTKEIFQNEI